MSANIFIYKVIFQNCLKVYQQIGTELGVIEPDGDAWSLECLYLVPTDWLETVFNMNINTGEHTLYI